MERKEYWRVWKAAKRRKVEWTNAEEVAEVLKRMGGKVRGRPGTSPLTRQAYQRLWMQRHRRKLALKVAGVPEGTKLNDPCPCGSGKRFKKCCSKGA